MCLDKMRELKNCIPRDRFVSLTKDSINFPLKLQNQSYKFSNNLQGESKHRENVKVINAMV